MPALACAAAAILLPTSLLGFLAHDQVSFGAWTHFAGVGLTALAATLAAVALTIVGARRNDGRTVLLGTAFTAMAALLASTGSPRRGSSSRTTASSASPARPPCRSAAPCSRSRPCRRSAGRAASAAS